MFIKNFDRRVRIGHALGCGMGVLLLLLVVTMITVLQGFEIVYVLTGDGGPGYHTMLPGLYMFFNGFTYNRMGYACAIGVILFLIMLGFTILNHIYLHSEQDFQG